MDNQSLSEKLALLNLATLEAIPAGNELMIVKQYTQRALDIFGADFGHSWFKAPGAKKFNLAYKSPNIPFVPEYPREHGITNEAIFGKIPILIENLNKKPNIKSDARDHMASVAVIPIAYEENTYGIFVLAFNKPHKFTSEERSMATALGNSAAQAITINRLYNNVTKMAYFDQLTQVPNRSFLNERLAEVHKKAISTKGQYAVFFIDLDRFKIINDIYGHHVGDMLLQQVAKRISKALPRKATLARMGGDEFIILLPRIANVDEAQKVGEKVQEVFTEFFIIHEHELYSNGSIGYATFPLNGDDPHLLMKNADMALHRAKDHGGGNVQQYQQGQPLFYTMQPKLQSQLRRAIKTDGLILQYQPIVKVDNLRVVGCEALVRWDHPELGLLYPDAFVGQAEESGLILEIGSWVMQEVCQQIQQWEKEGPLPPPVSINISPRELLSPSLVNNISESMKKCRIAPSQIRLELTETFLMKNIDLSIGILEQLKSLGLRLSIDDFGTGYASLNYLRRLPIDAVKVDQTFMAGIPLNLQDAAITSAIIAISHQLGLDVIAEGVENDEQLEFLRAAQCNFAQGNYFYQPMSGKDYGKLIRSNLGNNEIKTS